jgi:UDP-glucose 4-epimerase
MKRNFIILGASGFLGKNFASYLSSKGESVTCISRSKIVDKLDGIIYVEVNNYSDIITSKEDIVYHFAETNDIKLVESRGDPYVQDVKNLAISILEKDGFFVYASSTAVYNDNLDVFNNVNDGNTHRRTVYARAKLAVEELILQKEGVVARIGNSFGPGMSKKNIFSDVLRGLSNSSIQLREETPVRDYVYIKDVVHALYLMGNLKKKGIYNISSGRAVSCKELVYEILTSLGNVNVEVSFKYPPRRSIIKVEISDTIRSFNWKPMYDFKKAILETLEGKID